MPDDEELKRAAIYSCVFRKVLWYFRGLGPSLLLLLFIILLSMEFTSTHVIYIFISFTTGGVVFINNVTNLILIILIIAILVILPINIKSTKMKNYIPSLMVIIIITYSTLYELNQIELTAVSESKLLITNSNRIFYFEIVESCSGIYSMLLFLMLFTIFSTLTMRTHEFPLNQMLISGIVGGFGAFLVNLLRIIILIVISIKTNTLIFESTHLFIGGIMIIIYLACFWSIIWSALITSTSDKQGKRKKN